MKKNAGLTRRGALKAGAASVLAGVALPQVHAGETNLVKVALIGCGGRGTGAAANALSTTSGPISLVAMADVFQERLTGSFNTLNRAHAKKMDVPVDRRFIGFDAYQKAMDCLRPGDIAIFTTPPAFRWLHFEYAINKRLNVFQEKPVSVDGPSSKKMFDLAERSERANLKVGVGLMCRHCDARRELFDRIKGGAIGDVISLRAYRMAGPTASAFSSPKPAGISELMYQIQRFHSFLWASGGAYSDFLIHNIDEACWMKDAWPINAKASGGRHYRGEYIDQNFDTYSVEYTFADGTKFHLEGRTMQGAYSEFATYVHGARGSAIVSSSGHTPARPRIFRGHNFTEADVTWRWGDRNRREPDPYQLEWDRLLTAVRNNTPHNETRRGAEASLATSMGRMAAHTGVMITRDQILNSTHEFAPNLAELTIDGPAPVRAVDGKYPIPQPGIQTRREY